MANFTITLANPVSVFAGAPSAKWSAVRWNAFLWGSGSSDVQTLIQHPVANTLTLTDAYGKSIIKLVSESVAANCAISSIRLTDANGYFYVFREGTTDGETRVFPSWTSGTAASAVWTVGTTPSTAWS